MLVNNSSTLSPYNEGDICVYQGKQHKVAKRIFKIANITDMEKQIAVDLVDNTGSHSSACFWKSEYGKNPNIYKDGDNYRLVEINIGDTVEMWGFEYMYGQYKQFNPIGGYRLSEDDIEYAIPKSSSLLEDKVKELLGKIEDDKLKATCVEGFNTFYDGFIKLPAASKHHHNYIGGLLQHTYEVMLFAYNIGTLVQANTDYILTGAFFHDIMKTQEYDIDGKWLEYGDYVGHVFGSTDLFGKLAHKQGCKQNDITEIAHIILSHHGKKEWGSPVEPKTVEAVLVHEADMMSSYINPIFITKNVSLPKDYYLK